MAISLVTDAKIIILDEPTSGIDPKSRKIILDCITNFKQQGKSIIITTHFLEELEKLADNMGVIIVLLINWVWGVIF